MQNKNLMTIDLTLFSWYRLFMKVFATITSQGQLTIPKKMREILGIAGSTQVILTLEGKKLTMEAIDSFWSLQGSIKTDIKLSDEELRKAREDFEKHWARKM
jgi:AbrB family looped-hinge helix DNA binding protein